MLPSSPLVLLPLDQPLEEQLSSLTLIDASDASPDFRPGAGEPYRLLVLSGPFLSAYPGNLFHRGMELGGSARQLRNATKGLPSFQFCLQGDAPAENIHTFLNGFFAAYN